MRRITLISSDNLCLGDVDGYDKLLIQRKFSINPISFQCAVKNPHKSADSADGADDNAHNADDGSICFDSFEPAIAAHQKVCKNPNTLRPSSLFTFTLAPPATMCSTTSTILLESKILLNIWICCYVMIRYDNVL